MRIIIKFGQDDLQLCTMKPLNFMKTFVFATDFSRNANKVAYFAAQLAIKQNAKLVLFHAYRFLMPNYSDLGMVLESVEGLEQIAVKKLENLKKRIHQKIDKNLIIETFVKEGFEVEAIRDAAQEVKANLLLMSTVGEAPSGAKYFGSIATEMIKQSSVPLLLIPPKSKFGELKNIVFAIDLKKTIDAVAFEKSVQFIKNMDSVLDLVYVAKSEAEVNSPIVEEAALRIRELLIKTPHTFQTIIGDNATQEVIKFTKKTKAQMLITMPRHHSFFEKFFIEQHTPKLAFDAGVPVLAVS